MHFNLKMFVRRKVLEMQGMGTSPNLTLIELSGLVPQTMNVGDTFETTDNELFVACGIRKPQSKFITVAKAKRI